MSKRLASVPLQQIRRLQLYINTGRKSVSAIRAETGAAYVLNGGLYNMGTFQPLCHLRAEGVTYARDPYTYFGYLWDDGPDLQMGLVPDESFRNYLCCVELIRLGKPASRLIYNADMGGSRPRSAMGTKGDCLCLFASSDGMTPEALQAYLMAQGWDDAMMLDGGGSTQCDFDGETITSSRRVHNLLLVYTNEREDKPVVVNTYSLKKDGETKLAPNFRVREFKCQDGSDTILISAELVELLQSIRDHFGKAVNINSAYRTKSHNTAVGGSPKSQHMLGSAADIWISGVTPLEIAQYAEYLQPKSGGIGVYGSFVHVDVRTSRSRWDSRSGSEVVVSGWPGYEEPEAEPWYKPAQDYVKEKGISDGTRPLDNITRAEVWEMFRKHDKA